MAKTTVTSKGQITIPKEIRLLAMIHTGTEIEFQVDDNGRIFMIPITKDIREIKGIARKKRKRAVTLKEMERAIEEGASS